MRLSLEERFQKIRRIVTGRDSVFGDARIAKISEHYSTDDLYKIFWLCQAGEDYDFLEPEIVEIPMTEENEAGCPKGPAGETGPAGHPRKIPVLCLGRDPIPAGAVYAGRPGPLGNPYQIGPDGDRVEVIRKFSIDFKERLRLDEKYRNYLTSIRLAPALYCHCARPLPCHAEVIAAYLETLPS